MNICIAFHITVNLQVWNQSLQVILHCCSKNMLLWNAISEYWAKTIIAKIMLPVSQQGIENILNCVKEKYSKGLNLHAHFMFAYVCVATVEVTELWTVFHEHYSLLGKSSNMGCCISTDHRFAYKDCSVYISCLFSKLYSFYCFDNSMTSTSPLLSPSQQSCIGGHLITRCPSFCN